MTTYINSGNLGRLPSPLDIGEMAKFDDTIEEYDEAEQRRRRVIYLKSALDKLNLGRGIFKAFGCLLIPFLLFPLFWPFLILMYVLIKKQREVSKAEFRNALEYWRIDITEVDPEMTLSLD